MANPPTVRRAPVRLTPAQLATIVELLDQRIAAIARTVGASSWAVTEAVRRFRLHGWICRVELRACADCGAPLTVDPAHPRVVCPTCRRTRIVLKARADRAAGRASTSTPYVKAYWATHPEKLAARQEQNKAQLRARWPELPAERRATILEQAHAADQRAYVHTLDGATARGQRWTDADDAYVLAHRADSAREVA